jgi:phage replication O-like protein O
MAQLSGAELKVLLYIARRTYGFGKESDRISLSQIAEGIVKRDGTVLDRGTGISRSSVARALNTLEGMGIVLRETNLADTGKEFDENTYSINLAWTPSSQPGGGRPGPSSGNCGSEKGHDEVVAKSDHPPSKRKSSNKTPWVVPKSDHLVAKPVGSSPKIGPEVVPKSVPQETVQETEQETASSPFAPEQREGADADCSELVSMLVSHGVGEAVAEELVREKADRCRRCLDYLPFAHIKTTKGAYLANAIRFGYGPPEGYFQAKARMAADAARRAAPPWPESREVASTARIAKEENLRVKLAEIERSHPQAYATFLAFEEEERAKVQKILHSLSAKGRKQVLASWTDDSKRLALLERWLELVPTATYGPEHIEPDRA